jgi:hypothetical protein
VLLRGTTELSEAYQFARFTSIELRHGCVTYWNQGWEAEETTQDALQPFEAQGKMARRKEARRKKGAPNFSGRPQSSQ